MTKADLCTIAVCFIFMRLRAVLALGRIEFLHPGFHTDRRLWPIGYAAQRLAATPASGGREAAHLCEVLAAPDGSGPLFRRVCEQLGTSGVYGTKCGLFLICRLWHTRRARL